jgi:N-acetylglucosaminyldiphosphoundecaprenol N-acetyl-beta-D-mannosaminyltransferase
LNTLPTRDVLGVRIHALTMREVLEIVDETIRTRGHLLLGVVNAAKIVNMRRDAALGESVRSADLVLADGMPVVWASRLLRRPLPERVAGIDLMEGMLEAGRSRGYRVFCLGATDDVLESAVARMRESHPGVEIVGQQNGYFGADAEATVAERIRVARPDILLVAMTSPKKERFLARWSAHMDVPVCHGVGGSFDVLAGKVRRAPARWQRLGLEWLYRVLQEPRRMWRRYLVTNTLFCAMVARELFIGRVPAQPAALPVRSK